MKMVRGGWRKVMVESEMRKLLMTMLEIVMMKQRRIKVCRE